MLSFELMKQLCRKYASQIVFCKKNYNDFKTFTSTFIANIIQNEINSDLQKIDLPKIEVMSN